MKLNETIAEARKRKGLTQEQLAQKLYVVKKGLLPWFIHRRQIKKRVGINDMSKEIIDEYYFVPWSTKIIFSPPLWKMFNTISREEYPQKQWKKW